MNNNTEIEVVTVQYAFCKQDDGYIPVEDCKQCVYCEIVGEKMYCRPSSTNKKLKG